MSKRILIFSIIFIFAVFSFANCSFAEENTQNIAEDSPALKGSAVVNISSDFMDYYEEKDQIVARGNVKINVDDQDTTLEADKVTYEREKNLIIAEQNVKIINKKNTINGDFARIDLNEDSVLIDHPNTVINQIKIDAKTANIYPNSKDKNKKDVDAFNGTATINDKSLCFFLSSTGSKFINNPGMASNHQINNSDTRFKPDYKIKSKKILVKREKNVDIITLLNSTVTINKFKIAKIPSMSLTSNKETNQVETNFPEIGRKPQLGGYAGWGPVFNLPGGRALKTVPLITFDSGVGIGGLTRYTSATNRTELAYSTLLREFVIEGEQKLPFSKTTFIQYGKNAYVSNGIFGRQLPQFIIEAVDERKIFSTEKFDFDIRSSAAFIQEDHRWSTGRYQMQGHLYNSYPLYNIGKHIELGTSAQFNMAVYGTGDTYGVLRAGPTITTQAGPLFVYAAYYQGGVYGKTPLFADRYYYGKSNVTLNSSYRINRLLSLGYQGSFNLSKDNWDQKLIAENMLFCWLGPDDLKFRIGYDTKRKATRFDFNMLVGADSSSIEFDKLHMTEN